MTIDNYAANPLAERARLMDPTRFELVSAVVEPPKLFAGGRADLPAFTASGIDPSLLLKLPAGMRHAAAAEPDITKVHQWFEEFAGGPDAVIDSEGWREAKSRIRDWMDNTDLDTRTPEQRAADDEAGYAEFFTSASDRTTHAAEQHRRKHAGEDPLEDFDTLNKRHLNSQYWGSGRKVVSE